MILYENEGLDSITVEGILNASKDLFEKTVHYYIRDQNKIRRYYYKEVKKQIIVEFGNLIQISKNHLLSV